MVMQKVKNLEGVWDKPIKEKLSETYYGGDRTIFETAKELGLNPETIRKYMRKFNFKGKPIRKGISNSSWKFGQTAYRRIAKESLPQECSICGTTNRKLEVHHLDGNNLNNNIHNLVRICRKCHMVLDKRMKYLEVNHKKGDKIKVDIQTLKKVYDEHKPNREIAKMFGCSNSTISLRLRRINYGIKISLPKPKFVILNKGNTRNQSIRKQIKERDNYKCQLCKTPQKKLRYKLSIHHLDNNNKNNNPLNLISLCGSCHQRVHSNNKPIKNKRKINKEISKEWDLCSFTPCKHLWKLYKKTNFESIFYCVGCKAKKYVYKNRIEFKSPKGVTYFIKKIRGVEL